MSIPYSRLGQKHVELLRDLLPLASTIGLLVNPGDQNANTYQAEIEVALKGSRQHLEVLKARSDDDLEAAFTTMVQRGADVLVMMPDAFFYARRERLVALAASRGMPADLSRPLVPRGWRPNELWAFYQGPTSAGGDICRKNSPGS